ncbi:RHS repeat-associated core domain-containing protein [Nocardia sp. NPDC058114]|uniref:RHS repeat-associated core domain-containing protein n=1 Tax=Nocardia sp. NPDC058114 TaxID=3346346 RepID=UPI0036D8CF1D
MELPGVLTLMLTRRHRSSYRFGRWFGPSWAATLDMRVEVDQVGVRFVGPDGELWQFPHTAPDVPVRPVHQGTRATMTRTETGGYSVHDPDRELTYIFRPTVADGPETALGTYPITEITDHHHNRITFHYTSTGQPTEVAHTGGYRVRIDTTDDRVTGLTVLGTTPTGEPLETTVREFGYTAGDLTTVTNGVGATTTFAYDNEHRMLSWRDSRGTEMRNTYDRSGRVIEQVGTDNILSATFTYEAIADFRRSRTHHTNSLGATTTFEFDEDLCLRNLIDPRGATSMTDYNEYRQPVRHVDAYANTTVYLYNPDGDLVLVRRPDQQTISISYAAPRRPATITDVDGTTTTRTYDDHGNLTSVTDADGVTTAYTHHRCGAPASVTLSTGATTGIDVDDAGLPIRIVEPGNAVTVVERDMFGRPVTITDPLGYTSINRYSVEGKRLSRTDADGTVQSWTYDGEANLLTHTNQVGAITRYTYGTFDLVATRETADGAVTSYTHDTERRLTSVTNPLGDTWTYEYDPAGNVCTETDFNGSVICTDYDLLNRPSIITTPTGVQRRLTFDILGRFTGVSTDTGEWITNTYTPTGQLATARNGIHADVVHSVTFAHTPAGRVLTQHVDGRPVTYDYDEHGRRIGYSTPSGASTKYERTPTGRISALTTNGHRFDFTHDSIGRQNSWHSAGIGQHNIYSASGQTVSRELVRLDPRTSTPTRLLERDEYAWRPDGYITSHTTTSPTTSRRRDYTLDALGRITHIAAPSDGVTEQYSYDALSNLTTAEIPSSPAPSDPVPPDNNPSEPATDPRFEYRNNLLIRAGRIRYHYDTAGRLIRTEKTRISRKPAIWHYRYNAFDQLTEVTTPDNDTWTYTYDPFGRRTTKRHRSSETRFSWEGIHLAEQTTTTANSGAQTHTWANHPITHVPLTQSVDDQFWAIVTNLQGAPIHLADPTTGEIASTATTTLWGQTIWTGTTTPHRFQGQQHDPETGLHYNHHRYYDPETGRYLTQDPLGLAPAPNPATYPRNPTRWSDSLGLAPDCDGGIALGFSEIDGDPMALQDFASSVGARSYHDWPSQGDDWVNEFQNFVQDPDTPVHFNLDGLDDQEWITSAGRARGTDPIFDGHVTPWELSYIMDNRSSLSNVFFYRNGSRYDNPFT